MAHRPRWLTFAAVGLIAAFVFIGCTPAAAPTGTPAGTSTATQRPPTSAPTTGATSTPAGSPAGSPAASPAESPAGSPTETGAPATPAGTAYPEQLADPVDPAEITDAYPSYGEVDCEAGTFNGLPYSGGIQSITAPDPDTVVFTMCNPDVAFLSKLAFSVFAINDKEYLIEHAAAGDLPTFMNGTGPYEMVEWRRGSEILFSAFDGYWGEAAAVPDAVLSWATSPAARLDRIEAGTAHGMTLVGPDDFETVGNDPNLELLTSGGLNTLYLGMNRNFEPWDNPEVRQALAIGIDRQSFVDNFLPPGSEVASHFTPCSIPFACTGDEWPDTNVEEARQMITDIFGEAGLTTTLAYRDVARGYIPEPVAR